MLGEMKNARVLIMGAPGSGRTTLCEQMNNRIVSRFRSFDRVQLLATEGPDCAGPDLTLDQTQFILLIFAQWSGDARRESFRSFRPFAAHLRKSYPDVPMLVVGNKFGLFPEGTLSATRAYRVGTLSPLRLGIQSTFVDASTGDGVDDLCRLVVDIIYPIPVSIIRTSMTHLQVNVERTISLLLDLTARLFALPVPQDVNRDTTIIEYLEEANISDLEKSPEAKAWHAKLRPGTNFETLLPVCKIKDIVVKDTFSADEFDTMVYVRKNTTIPVPQPRYRHFKKHLAMDFVEGWTLLECWDSLSLLMKFRVACTLRGYVSQLRQLRGDVPGGLITHCTRGHLFDFNDWGPFRSAVHFQHVFNDISFVGYERSILYNGRRSSAIRPPFDNVDWSLCLVHGDLNMGNAILSDDGVLWIIDWTDSGYLPPWFESYGFLVSGRPPRSWLLSRWFIFGLPQSYDRILDTFETAIEHVSPEIYQ